MALYSRANLVTLIRDEINEPVARIFSGVGGDSAALELDRFVDLGARACSAITLCNKTIEDPASGSVVTENQYKYVTSSQFIEMESVYYYDTGESDTYALQRIRPEAIGSGIDYTAGRAKFYTFFASTIFVWPRVSAAGAAANDKLIAHGYTVVTSFGDGDSETLPAELQFVPFYYAMACVYATLGQHQKSAVNMQQFILECNQYRYDVHGDIKRPDTWDMAQIPSKTVSSPS